MEEEIRTLYWQDNSVVMIDQRALPMAEVTLTCTDYRQVITAIKDLTVRGAPAIGVAAALGIALGSLKIEVATPEAFREDFAEICKGFAAARPTARNLFWSIERMERCFAAALRSLENLTSKRNRSGGSSTAELSGMGPRRAGPEKAESDPWRSVREALVAEAIRISAEDMAINRQLGAHGAALVLDGASVLTHCNAGALATAGYGTALGVLRAAREAGKQFHVYVDETRPVLQGARLTAWELTREKIPCTLITDSMAGFLMQQNKIDLVITGADRIAANGDTANKIGTYSLAVLARSHQIPFYVAAPCSTIDPSFPDGKAIPIEERSPLEVTGCGDMRTAPEGISVYNPAFDITPHHWITAIVTESGIVRPPYRFFS
ncbi:MAG: S-methyl-5-thioribose-1-phosphate isomerase [Syntrophaceae bacterium]|nr:S-methyl-5-thioribose-1-phosphate isomerase [Syntrophaceae bacterium]